jgi:hypothetical protein
MVTTENGTTKVTIDLDSLRLTNRDARDFKRVTGKSIAVAFEGADSPEWQRDPDWDAIAALTWILVRKQQPEFTYEDALDTPLDSDILFGLASQVPPPDPTPAPSTTGGARTRTTSR